MSDPLTENKSLSFWKRPWRGRSSVGAWFALLATAIFLIVCCLALLLDHQTPPRQVILISLMISLGIPAFGIAVVTSVRWLCCWRNFRRFLFGVACLVTLVVLIYAAENWRGKHAWQKHRRESEAKGEKFDFAVLAPPPVPDDKNLALAPLLKPMMDFSRGPQGIIWHDTNGTARLGRIALDTRSESSNNLVLGNLEKGTLADLKASRELYRGNTNYPQASPNATPAEAILIALGKFDPELKELRAAAASRPYARFPIEYDYQPPWGILLPHLARLRPLTQWLHLRATASLEAGRAAEALEDLQLGLRLSDSIRDEPIVIDHLVRIDTLSVDLQTIREGLVRHAWSDPQLSQLETYLTSVDILAEYERAIRGERALSATGLDFLRRGGADCNPLDYLGDGQGASFFGGGFRFIPSGWFYQNMLTLSRMYQQHNLPTVDARARRVFPEASARREEALKQMRVGPYTAIAKLVCPALEKAIRKSAQMQFYVDAARIACALERYRLANGSWPDKLDQLTPQFLARIPNDIIDGKPLRFRRDANKGYALYSVGWNQTDDNGEVRLSREKLDSSVDITQGDWVWSLPL